MNRMATEEYKDSSLFPRGYNKMSQFRWQKRFCDLTLKCDNEDFHVHRLVLAATIPYFQAMFNSNMAESQMDVIRIQSVEPSALESLLNFAYNGRIELCEDNIQNILIGASYLQLNNVRDACSEFLINHSFHPFNILGIRCLANSTGCRNLYSKANEFINRNFKKVAKYEEFHELEYDELIELIGSNDLIVYTEENVFEACMRWIKYIKDKRVEYLPEILQRIRLKLLPHRYLVEEVLNEEMILSSLECKSLVENSLATGRIDHSEIFGTKRLAGLIYVTGGSSNFSSTNDTLEIYNPITGARRIGEKMPIEKLDIGVGVGEGKLFVFGGENVKGALSTVEAYDPKTNKWSNCREMLDCKRCVAVATLNDCIYVCGGYDGVGGIDPTRIFNTVDCYYPATDTWKRISPMLEPRFTAGAAALNGYVYVVGGYKQSTVERYDPLQETWTTVQSMSVMRQDVGVAVMNGKLYACGGREGPFGDGFLRSAEVYDPDEDTWSPIASMKFKRAGLALVANMGKLWAIGGCNGESNELSIEVYDPVTNKWSLQNLMRAGRCGHGAGVIYESIF